MKFLKRWMVGIDLTDHDLHVISFTSYLNEAFIPDEIVFIHIKKREDIPPKFRKKTTLSKNELLNEIEEKVYKRFQKNKNIICEVHEGTPSFDLWRECHLHKTDLFIAGEKEAKSGRRIVPEKFAQKSFCSILFVPPHSKSITHIWAPTDFSKHSKDAIDLALEIQSKYKTRITCQNVFEAPNQNLIEKEMIEEYIEYYRTESQNKMNNFLKGLEIEKEFTPMIYAHIADHIKEKAEDCEADLIVISSGGKSRLSSLLLGSTTSEMIKLEKSIPLLVLKKNIDRVRAWDILTNL